LRLLCFWDQKDDATTQITICPLLFCLDTTRFEHTVGSERKHFEHGVLEPPPVQIETSSSDHACSTLTMDWNLLFEAGLLLGDKFQVAWPESPFEGLPRSTQLVLSSAENFCPDVVEQTACAIAGNESLAWSLSLSRAGVVGKTGPERIDIMTPVELSGLFSGKAIEALCSLSPGAFLLLAPLGWYDVFVVGKYDCVVPTASLGRQYYGYGRELSMFPKYRVLRTSACGTECPKLDLAFCDADLLRAMKELPPGSLANPHMTFLAVLAEAGFWDSLEYLYREEHTHYAHDIGKVISDGKSAEELDEIYESRPALEAVVRGYTPSARRRSTMDLSDEIRLNTFLKHNSTSVLGGCFTEQDSMLANPGVSSLDLPLAPTGYRKTGKLHRVFHAAVNAIERGTRSWVEGDDNAYLADLLEVPHNPGVELHHLWSGLIRNPRLTPEFRAKLIGRAARRSHLEEALVGYSGERGDAYLQDLVDVDIDSDTLLRFLLQKKAPPGIMRLGHWMKLEGMRIRLLGSKVDVVVEELKRLVVEVGVGDETVAAGARAWLEGAKNGRE